MNLLIKPASGSCNMRCRYCFYADEMSKREASNFGIMTNETAKKVLKQCLAAKRQPNEPLVIAFQGGEPMLAGLEFFKNFVAAEKRLNTQKIPVMYSLQTNGLLIDDSWCAFLKEENFLVGISLDGNKDTCDRFRVDARSKSVFNRIMHTIDLLKKYRVEFNILSVVTNELAKNIGKVYRFYEKQGFVYQQYIAAMDPLWEEIDLSSRLLDPKVYGRFLCDLFDLWEQSLKQGKLVHVGYFIDLVNLLRGGAAATCGLLGKCSLQYVVEADGSVYPCDFYVLDEYRIGSFLTDSVEKVDENRKQIGFIEESESWQNDCKGCRYQLLCRGGCRRLREPFVTAKTVSETETPLTQEKRKVLVKNQYCESYRLFFDYALERLIKIART